MTWGRAVARLAQRDNPKWESLSWLALRPLIDSLNDRVNALTPSLVPELRAAWLERTVEQHGPAPTARGPLVIDRRGTRRFVVMGDTGEQDASQYVVGDALTGVVPDVADFAVICSDVIYPSGDLNDYVHGFYLPYEPLLQDPGTRPTPEPQRLYGLPGNHDWYDGLTGFMATFCDVPALPPSAYPAGGTGARERIGRLLWRRPSRPQPARLHKDDDTRYTPQQLRDAMMRPATPETRQPGPYFAIEVDGLLLVCIDGGIGLGGGVSMIDAAQARWLLEVSALDRPKVLLTGYPLLVNGEWKECRFESASDSDAYRTVNAVVAEPDFRYVAAIGGDIHNFQHYTVTPVPGARPIVYLVSGGGGAYISATHPIASAAHVREERAHNFADIVASNSERGGPPGPAEIERPPRFDSAAMAAPAVRRLGPLPSGHEAWGDPDEPLAVPVAEADFPHRMVPDAAESLAHFTEQVLPKTWRYMRSLLMFGLGGALAAGWRALWASSFTEACVLGGGVLLLAVQLHLSIGAPDSRSRERRVRRQVHAYRASVAAGYALAGFVAVAAGLVMAAESAGRYLQLWVLITLFTGAVSYLQRRSGWWREPGANDWSWTPALMGVLLVAVGFVAAWQITDETHLALLTHAAGLLVVTAVVGVALRRRHWWRSVSLNVALVGQLAAALFVLSAAHTPTPGGEWRPVGAVTGVVLDAVVLVATLWAVAGRLPRRIALTTVALAVPATLAALTWAFGHFGGSWDAGARSFAMAGLVAGWLAAGVVGGTFGVDALRRRWPSGYRPASTAVLAVVAVAGLSLWRWWLVQGLVIAGVVVALSVVTLSVGYLVFLGGLSLALDHRAHRDTLDRADDEPLLTVEQAALGVRWRRTGVDAVVEQLPSRLRNRVRFVFPSTDQPQGVIQEKVSEFFSADAPPFHQHYLDLEVVGPVGHPTRLVITPHVVTGVGPQASHPRAPIVVPL
ncbi:hypothetical protein ACIB24_21215 [Spongisporangium articulatum]|uniref:Calcineurin-like phosphoesterase domain-containing protein n=1 Tax=Spongisporangium articulatum TaxID=3362603 RepID=A0ABW8AT97_9ACTN